MVSDMKIFIPSELKLVEEVRGEVERLVGKFYALAPREWERMHYEVRTLSDLAPEEVCHQAFAQVLCYDCIKRVGPSIVKQHDLYRICLQDHRILEVAQRGNNPAKLDLEAMLLYVLTHELVHIIRFSQQLQQLDLALELRPMEERSVEHTTRQILAPLNGPALRKVVAACSTC
jgi:hypothetical protein